MTDRSTTALVFAAAAISLLAAGGAEANRLLNEQWLKGASAAQVNEEIAGGADVNAVNAERGYTPLMVVSRFGNLEAMEALLEAGADPKRSAREPGSGPMHWAANGLSVELLFDWGAKIDPYDKRGATPLHYAAGVSRLDAMHALIRRGADVNARSVQGQTPLYRAARDGQLAAAQILLDAGAEINLPSATLVTPLYVAAKLNTPQMVEVLLDAGADPTIQTDNGWFAAQTAVRNNPKVKNHPVFARLLDPLFDIPALGGEVSDAPCDGWRVKPGDTVGLILDEGTGDRSGWLEFSRMNNLSGANMHRVGMCLKLPDRRAGAQTPSRPAQACTGYVVKGSPTGNSATSPSPHWATAAAGRRSPG